MTANQKVGSMRRSFEIARVGAKYFLFNKLNRNRYKTLGLRLRLACEELGLTFIKLGQILATRYDLLSRSDCEELQKLLDQVPPFEHKIVRDIFLNDFGKYPEDLYLDFNPQPIAAASIAQVYKAKLEDGSVVAVKVRRPNVDRSIKSDIRIFLKIANIVRWFSAEIRYIDMKNILGQIEGWLIEETNFIQEIDNLEEVVKYYDRNRDVLGEYVEALVIPRAYRHLSGNNVITMDFIEGIPVRQFKTVLNDPSYDAFRSLKVFMGAMMRGWIHGENAVFTGDPHPSNLLLLPGGKLGLLDFGLLLRMDKKHIRETRDLLLAVYSKDLNLSIKKALLMCGASYEKYADIVREDVRKYLETTQDSGMGYWFVGFIKIFIKYRIPFPYQLVLFGRIQAIIEGLFETITPGVTTLEVFGEELERGLKKQIWENLSSTNLTPIFYALTNKIKSSPEKASILIDKYFEDPLKFIRDIKEALSAY